MTETAVVAKLRMSITQPGYMDDAPEATFVEAEGDLGTIARIFRTEVERTAEVEGLPPQAVGAAFVLALIRDGRYEGMAGGWRILIEPVE